MIRRSPLVFCILACMAAASAHAATNKLSVVANGEVVGHLTAVSSKSTVKVDYSVFNNGRGASSQEEIVLDGKGLPIGWSVEGKSLFGAKISERFSWKSGQARWKSQADTGEAQAKTTPLYVASDASPWVLGLYAKALLAAPGHTLPVLPSGSVRLEEVKRLELGVGSRRRRVTIYELSGLKLEPDYVLVDGAGELFGTLGGLAGGLIREGYEDQAKELGQVAEALALERAQAARQALAHQFTGPIYIRNVRIFDPVSGALSAPSTVTVYGDTITQVASGQGESADATGATVIDGEGGALLPGLHDMHSHTTLSNNLSNLAAGVTTTRDMGNKNDSFLAMMGQLEAGKLAGPRVVRAGYIEGRSAFSSRNGIVADTLDEALQAVHWYADRGYWQIKLYNSIKPEWVKPLADEAHRLGLGVTGHVPAFSTPDRVIEEGYDTIAHINQLMLGWLLAPGEDTRTPLRLTAMVRAKDLDLTSAPVLATLDLMKRKNASLDTTVEIYERMMLSRAGKPYAGDLAYIDHMPVGYRRAVNRTFVPIDNAQTDQDYQAAFGKVLQTLALLDSRGVQLLPGTDTETLLALHRELELYVAAGLTPAHTLRLATLDAEHYLGRANQLGTIARGKLADIILVAGDPTRNISDIRQVRMTMVGGVIYFPAEIYSRMGVRPIASPPPVTRR